MTMTNLEHFKRSINADNLCDKLNCRECPLFSTNRDFNNPCFKRLKEWCLKEYKHATMYERWCDFTDKVTASYRKAKAEMMEGM